MVIKLAVGQKAESNTKSCCK